MGTQAAPDALLSPPPNTLVSTPMDLDLPTPALAALRQQTVPLGVFRALGVPAPQAPLARTARGVDGTLYPLGALHRCYGRAPADPEDEEGTGVGRGIKRGLSAAFDAGESDDGDDGDAPADEGGVVASQPVAELDVAQEEEGVPFVPPAYTDGNPLTAAPSNEPAQHRKCVAWRAAAQPLLRPRCLCCSA